MKHICFFTLSMLRGGAEGVIARLCNDSLRKYYQITIITCMNLPVEQTLQDDIQIVSLDTKGKEYANMAERFLKRRKLLKMALTKLQPDLLISFLPEPNFIALSLKKSFSFPMIFSIRNDPNKEYRNPVYRMLMRYYYPKADGAVFQTAEAKKYFSFSKKLSLCSSVIANPLGKDYQNLQVSVSRNDSIVSVGRLEQQKNQKLLIRAFSKLVEEYPKLNLKIYGEGPLEKELMKIIQCLHLQDKVQLCGNVPNIKERIKNSRMFVLCSEYEGIPNSLMEAMAMGIPCIATDCPCGGCSFLIQNHINGILTPVGEEQKLLDAMRWLLQNEAEAERLAIKAMEDIKKVYPDQIYLQWQEYIQKYIGE